MLLENDLKNSSSAETKILPLMGYEPDTGAITHASFISKSFNALKKFRLTCGVDDALHSMDSGVHRIFGLPAFPRIVSKDPGKPKLFAIWKCNFQFATNKAGFWILDTG